MSNNAIFAARLWAALEGTPMGHARLIICAECGRERRHQAHNLCSGCYSRIRTRAQRTSTKHPDPLTRLPVPAMVRCAGAPGITCTRAARADVGRCWRCQQEAARAGVAA